MGRVENGSLGKEQGHIEAAGYSLNNLQPTRMLERLIDMEAEILRNPPRLLILDRDGVLVKKGERFEVEPMAQDLLQEIHTGDSVPHIAIVTNEAPKDERGFTELAWVVSETTADLAVVPLGPEDFKPSSRMFLKAMEFFGITPDETMVVDNQMTAGTLAANWAGIQKNNIVVETYGRDNVPNTIRQTLESWLKVYFSLRKEPLVPSRSSAGEKLQELLEAGEDFTHLIHYGVISEKWDPQQIPEDIVRLGDGKISGYGGPVIELHPDVETLIPKMFYEPLLRSARDVRQALEPLPSWLRKGIQSLRREHGRTIADFLTDMRDPLAVEIAYCILTGDLETANKLFMVALGTDGFDGYFAKGYKIKPKPEDGVADEQADKRVQAAVDIPGVVTGVLPVSSLLRPARDVARSKLGKAFRDRGFDTSALKSGKRSTKLHAAATLFSLSSYRRRYPRANRLIQGAATIAKVSSLFTYPDKWRRTPLREEHSERELRFYQDKLRGRLQ